MEPTAGSEFLKPATPVGKVIRMPGLKRGREDLSIDERVKLERVLGLTVTSNAALDCEPNLEQVAYPAGCTVVLFNIRKNKQRHLLNISRKTITSLAFSPDGKFLATGECGHAPSLRIWNLQDDTQIADFQGHKYGINCVAFSPNGKYVVSVGSQHDMIVNVWDWRNNVKIASNKVSARVKAVSFSENGGYFVTVGNRSVKFWYLEYTKANKYKDPVPLVGRSAILGDQRDNYFCDVACGRGSTADSTFAITKSGLLCEFNLRRLLDQWVELRTRSANCMTVSENYIFIGCADGIVRCFSPKTLQFIVTLPRTHYLGVDVASGLDISHVLSHPNDAKYPDALAVTYDAINFKLTVVYNDHSLYVWDVADIHRVGKSHSFLYHSACIWGVEVYPEFSDGRSLPVPPGSFITCSSDDTIRFWNFNGLAVNDENTTIYKRNIYSKDLLKVLYIDKELTYLKDLDLANSSGEKAEASSYDGKNGVRSVRISPDGLHLASGDRQGNVRIHDLKNLRQLVMIEAHDAEVLNLEYTKDVAEKLFASASRDRLIHVFNVSNGYECVQTLDDHSSSITAVRFLNTNGQLQMVSCSADKSIIFRPYQSVTSSGLKQFVRDHNVAGKTTLYDMEVDVNERHILTACQDRNIRVYNAVTRKHSKTFKGSLGEDGTLIKVSLDNSGIYVATSCTDKSLSVYDYYSGECMATMLGHSELVTGLRFTNDCKRLISASGDGCIFIWKLPKDMVVTMKARLEQQAVRRARKLNIPLHSLKNYMDDDEKSPEIISDADVPDTDSEEASMVEKQQPGFRFSVGQLPAWARRGLGNPLENRFSLNDSPEHPIHTGYSVVKINKPPMGRWAERIESNNELVIAAFSPDKQPKTDSLSSLDSNHEEKKKEEGAEFDGDVEDSDVDMETPYYYPISNENKNDYTVNANDIEELRRSHRKMKRPVTLPGIAISTVDSDDINEASSETETPSVEKDLLHSSSDGINMLESRESYFRSHMEMTSDSRLDPGGKSISSQYLVRNTSVIQAAKQTMLEIKKDGKREELKKRLEDTRRTLQSSGLGSSPLRASQSTCDLSRFSPNKTSSQTHHQPSIYPGNHQLARVDLHTLFHTPNLPKPRPNSLNFRSNNNNLSLPESPTENSGAIKRSCTFHVDYSDAKEKEQLLLAHDKLGAENAKLAGKCIDTLLEDFSSDSLESESSRKCFSDFPLVGRDDDTDYSGLNSLQGSGDLLEMQEVENERQQSPQAFFVEIDAGSPRRHKPILRAKSLPGKKLSVAKSSAGLKKHLLPNKFGQDVDGDDEEGLRRAISLSDLSAPSGSSSVKSSKIATYNNGITPAGRNINNNNPPSHTSGNSMQRCRSVGVLNRTDSESDVRESRMGSGLMRPTISSQNKTAVAINNRSGVSNLPKRRTVTQSSVNLSTAGLNDDSSSEEVTARQATTRNNQIRRPTSLNRHSSMKDLSYKAKEVTARLTSSTTVKKSNKNVEVASDVANAPLTKQLCTSVITQTSMHVDNLVVLHKRLNLEAEKQPNKTEILQMAEDIEKSTIEIQQRLMALTAKLKNNNSVIRNQLATTNNFLGNNLGFPMPHLNNNNLMSNIDVNRFSEMLVNMVQQRMSEN